MSPNTFTTLDHDSLASVAGGAGSSTQTFNGVDFQQCMAKAGRPGATLQGLQPTSFNGEAWNDGLEKIGTVSWQGRAGGNGQCKIVNTPPRR